MKYRKIDGLTSALGGVDFAFDKSSEPQDPKGTFETSVKSQDPDPPRKDPQAGHICPAVRVCVCVRVDITVSLCALVVFCVCFNTPDKGFCLYPMLRNSASGPEIGHPGRISAGF